MKVFFSYGHDHHGEFVNRVKNDLKKNYDIDVWIDSEELKAKNDWEIELENAISNSDEVVFFITPYSSRRPDGYCLNELAFSIAKNKEITPIMIDYITPPLSICRIQYMDIQNLVDSFDEDLYKKFLSDLSNILLNNKSLSTEGDHTNFLDTLNPIDFSNDIKKHLMNFVGRQWLYDMVNNLLEEDYNLLWIKAKAGFGKTAFSTMLQHKHPNAVGIHYCQFDSPRRKSASSVLKTLIFQLSTQIPEYKKIISSYNFDEIKQKDENLIFEELLVIPLNKIKRTESCFFIIDALDESHEDGKNKLADMVKKFIDLPPWLKIVITSRPEPYLKRKLSQFKTLEIDTSSHENSSDLELFIEKNLNFNLLIDIDKETIIKVLIKNSEGNILYLKEVIKYLNENSINKQTINLIPKGIDALYLNMFERYFEDKKDYKQLQRPLFELITCTQLSLSFNFIKTILDWDDYDLEDAIEPIGSIADIQNKKIKFFHKSISDWIVNRSKAGREFFVSSQKGEEKILDFIMENDLSKYKKLVKDLFEGILLLKILQKKCNELIEDNLIDEANDIYKKISSIRKIVYNYPETNVYSGLKEFCKNDKVNNDDILEIEKNNYFILDKLKDKFTNDYIFSIIDYSYLLNETGNFKYGMNLQEKLILEMESLIDYENDDWFLTYVCALNELAITYGVNSEVQKAITLDKKSLQLLEENIKNDDELWNEIYINTLSNFAMSYSNTAETKEALKLEEKAKIKIEKLYSLDSKKWENHYIKCLNNYSISLKDTNQAESALEMEKKILEISENNHKDNPSLWVNRYTLILNNLAFTYKILGKIDLSIELEKKALELSKEEYQKNKGSWCHVYLKSMLNLALSYKSLWNLDDAINLEELVVEISKNLYDNNPSRWSDVYTRALASLGISYSMANRYSDAYNLEKLSVDIRENLYNYDPKRWIDAYGLSVNNFAITNFMQGNLELSKKLFQEILEKREQLYLNIPERWEYIYVQSLMNMSLFMILTNDYKTPFELIEKAYKIYEKLFNKDPKIWIEGYVKILTIKGAYFYLINDLELSTKFLKIAYEKKEALFLSDKMKWKKPYLSSLLSMQAINMNLEEFREKIQDISKNFTLIDYSKKTSNDLIKEALLLEISHKQSPYRWSDAFI